jgi:hypothetical protein
MFWFIGFLVLAVFACIFVYRTAEVHELHNVRAAFENRERDIKKLIQERSEEKDFNKVFYEGEIEELEELKKEIDAQIEKLKNFDI